MKQKSRNTISWLALLAFCILLPSDALSRIKPREEACVKCHTMHNSQSQQTLTGGAPLRFLINDDCIGCHSGHLNDPAVQTSTPYIFKDDDDYLFLGVTGNTLAAGTFRYVASSPPTNDNCGHNVVSVSDCDSIHGMTPPGGTSNGHQLTCAGSYGCHGDRSKPDVYDAMKFSHHGGNDDPQKNGGAEAYRSYRLLQYVAGYEDSDWEYRPTNDSHNQYKGYDRFNPPTSLTNESLSPSGEDTTTISYFCARCHGDFHNGAGSRGVDDNDSTLQSPWIRHPTDIDMEYANGAGYTAYGGATTNKYDVIVPLGSRDISSVLPNVFQSPGAGDAIVTCISCHRAHGSRWPSSLRWNWRQWPPTDLVGPGASGAYNGCAICHTSKD